MRLIVHRTESCASHCDAGYGSGVCICFRLAVCGRRNAGAPAPPSAAHPYGASAILHAGVEAHAFIIICRCCVAALVQLLFVSHVV